MRSRTVTGYFAPLGIVLALTLGACASPVPAGSGTGATASTGGTGAPSVTTSSAPGSSAPGSSAPADAPGSVAQGSAAQGSAAQGSAAQGSAAQGTQSVIPAAPGTAGSGVLPPVDTAPPVTSGDGVVATPLPACKSTTSKTVSAGKLTITTPATTAAPWFVGNNPVDGRGLEPAVALAVAKELGYSAADVVWTRSNAAELVAGKTSGFDVALGEFATPDQGPSAVDYSTGYFSISQSVVARTGTPAAAAKNLAQLASARLATVSGTKGAAMASAQITGSKIPAQYPTAAAGLAALRAGTVDAVVVATPVAVTAGAGVTIVGQLVEQSEQPPQFGMILPKGSPLTSCVSAAIDQLRVTGALKGLVQAWVPAAAKPLR
ncbi:polar amino acid transport system substrate-binding protein [Nakamurella sp. UYEF19]|uniref:substrate-binding periplasmic protein n=1 Tax=Nakamurella sp. UYEF19 TaxID=1756392 RepID=UPI00339A7B9D